VGKTSFWLVLSVSKHLPTNASEMVGNKHMLPILLGYLAIFHKLKLSQ